MIQLPKEFKDTTPAWLGPLLGGVFGVVGFFILCFGIGAVLLGASFETKSVLLGLGAGFIVLGIGCLIQLHWNYVRQTINCTPAGFSVLSESKRKGVHCEEYQWREVTGTKYEYTLRRRKNAKRITGLFSAETGRGPAFEIHHSQSDFQDLITVFNERASHLPYIWARDSTFAPTVMLASSARPEFNKVPRPSPQAIPPPLPGSRPPPLPPSV